MHVVKFEFLSMLIVWDRKKKAGVFLSYIGTQLPVVEGENGAPCTQGIARLAVPPGSGMMRMANETYDKTESLQRTSCSSLTVLVELSF